MTDEMLKDAQCLFAFLAEAEEGPDRAEIVLAMGSQDLMVADTAVQAFRETHAGWLVCSGGLGKDGGGSVCQAVPGAGGAGGPSDYRERGGQLGGKLPLQPGNAGGAGDFSKDRSDRLQALHGQAGSGHGGDAVAGGAVVGAPP